MQWTTYNEMHPLLLCYDSPVVMTAIYHTSSLWSWLFVKEQDGEMATLERPFHKLHKIIGRINCKENKLTGAQLFVLQYIKPRTHPEMLNVNLPHSRILHILAWQDSMGRLFIIGFLNNPYLMRICFGTVQYSLLISLGYSTLPRTCGWTLGQRYVYYLIILALFIFWPFNAF